jgi:ABC-type multidrug transport system permease subunit
VLLCDEPTSGLDAKMAADVVAILRALSRRGRTIVATIHQPSFQLFSAFDALVLLNGGRVAFTGETSDAANHFGQLGFPTPQHENPADYMMRLLQDPDEARGVDFVAAWATSEAATKQQLGQRSALPSSSTVALPSTVVASASAGYAAQTAILLRRTLYDAFKDPSKVFKVVVLKSMVGLLTGTIWFGQGRSGSYADIFSISGALFMCVTTATLEVLLDTVLEFPLARALLLRELANGHYSLPAYYAARTLANLAFACFNTLLVAVPVYLMVGLNLHASKFGIFSGCLVLLELIGSCIGILVGANARDINDARTTLLPTLAPLLIFSGYVVPKANIPVYFTWAYYVSFFQYAFGVLMINELSDRTFDRDCPAQLAEEAIVDEIVKHFFPNGTPPQWINWTHPVGNWTCSGHSYLAKINMWPVPYGGLEYFFAILGGYFAASFVGAYAMLRWKTRAVVN